jgi:hypothetical protein
MAFLLVIRFSYLLLLKKFSSVEIKLSNKALVTTLANFMPLQCWVAAKQEMLKPGACNAFHKSLVLNVLGKGIKLEIMVIKANSPVLLKTVKNLQVQLEAISAHLHSHDCAEVMTVVLPLDVYNMSAIHEKTYNVLQDCAMLQIMHYLDQ